MKRHPFQWPLLSTRVTLLTLVIFLTGVWSLTVFVSDTIHDDMARQLGQQQFSAATLITEQVQQQVAERKDALDRTAAKASEVAETDLAAFLQAQPAWQALFNSGYQLLSPSGNALLSTFTSVPQQPALPALSALDMARVLESRTAIVTATRFSTDLNAPIMSIAVPIRAANGRLIAVLAAVTRLDQPNFLSKVVDKHYGQTGGYVITDGATRQIIAATDRKRVTELLPPRGTNPKIDRFEKGYEGSDVLVNSHGVELLVSARAIPGTSGWHAVVTLPTAEAFAPVKAAQQRARLAAIVLTLIAGGVMWWRLRQLFEPLEEATATISQVTRAAALPPPIPVVRRDEIGMMIESFNHLIDQLGQRETALKESEFRWKFAIEGSGDGVWDWNIQSGDASWSARTKEILGYPRDDKRPNTYRSWLEHVHPDDRAGVELMVQSCLKGQTPSYHHEYRVNRTDGSLRWILSRGMVVARGRNGEPLRMIGTDADITQRKRVEQFEQFRGQALEQLAEGQPIKAILESLVRGVEAIDPTIRASILLVDTDGRHLIKGAAPSLPDFYNEAINGLTIAEGIGSCGTAAATGHLVIVEDIMNHPYWANFRDLAAKANLGSCWSQAIVDNTGRVMGTFGIYHDHPHRPTAEDLKLIDQCTSLANIALVHARDEARLRQAADVFSHAREGIMITDHHGLITDVNEAFFRITGYTRDEVVGKRPSILKSGRQDASFYQGLWATLNQQGYWSGEIWNRRKDGLEYAELLTISAVKDEFGQVTQYVGLFSDITSIKEHERRLEHIAHFDALTGLPNRVLLADRLHQAMSQTRRRHQKLAVAYLDLDGFKAINDSYGHEAGDQLLSALSHRMKSALREGDTLARLGGDEFVAVLLDVDEIDHCLPILSRLLAAAATPVDIEGRPHQVSASVGLTLYPQGEEVDADQLLRQADQAMYQAKLAGKNRFHLFDPEQDRNLRGHHASIEHIRQALLERQFVLHYQPKVNMRTGRVIGAEALIRWQHPENGLLPPGQFLPIIEDNALSIELGDWVIAEALDQMSRWKAKGLVLPVSVNLSARQLQQADFLDGLSAHLARHPELGPRSLELEVLETSALDDLSHATEVMAACQGMGVRFALDDFGTGYSSLTYLKRLPISILKIDQSFVRDMRDDPDDLAILKGILSLSAAFRREVIAEGVETEAHGLALLGLGCELGQGYGIARPMPADKIPEWVATWHPPASWLGNLNL